MCAVQVRYIRIIAIHNSIRLGINVINLVREQSLSENLMSYYTCVKLTGNAHCIL